MFEASGELHHAGGHGWLSRHSEACTLSQDMSRFVAVQSLAFVWQTSLWHPQGCVTAQAIKEGITWFLPLPIASETHALQCGNVLCRDTKALGHLIPLTAQSSIQECGCVLSWLATEPHQTRLLAAFSSKAAPQESWKSCELGQVRAGLALIETISSKGLCTDIQGVHYVLLRVLKFEQLKTKQRKKIFFKKEDTEEEDCVE